MFQWVGIEDNPSFQKLTWDSGENGGKYPQEDITQYQETSLLQNYLEELNTYFDS